MPAHAAGAVPTTGEERWQHWLLERNRRGLRTLLSIVVGLYPAFAVVDALVAPRTAWPVLFATRALVTAVTLCMFRVVRGSWFERHPNSISAGYMLLCACGISLMTVFMGGLSSPYYAGLTLAIVATGLLFVWPKTVVWTTHSAIVASFVGFNLFAAPRFDFTSFSNLAFLISTALIAGIGQTLLLGTHRAQIEGRSALEGAKANLERTAGEVEQLLRFKSQFFANITHELRTPLAMILSPLELMLSGDSGKFTEAQRGTFASMFKSGLKLLKMIGDLLDLAKLEEARLRLRIGEHELVDQLRGLIAQISELARRKHIEIKLTALTERAFIWCDAERMERVFVNLLSNAIKFTDPGGHIEVRVEELRAQGEASGNAVRITVQDDGCGFPAEAGERVFERFYQLDMGGTRRYGGSGIGLALAKELVELHGGKVSAESEPGKGARFAVELPYGRAHFKPEVLERREPKRDAAAGQRQDDGGVIDWSSLLSSRDDFRLLDIAEVTERRIIERDADEHLRPHSVLVVDDTPDIVRLVHMALRNQFRVLAAADGRKGLELAARALPSLIVTDLMMPEMSGLELTAKLRENPLTRHIPIIMLTARADLDDRVAGIDQGVNAYLAKPFSPKELLSTARQLVNATDATADRLLAQRMDSLEIVAGGLAHEINNPLNYLKNSLAKIRLDAGVLAQLALATRKRSLTDQGRVQVERIETRMREFFDIAESGIKRISNTVELMRGYGRAGYSRIIRDHDVNAAVAQVVRLVLPATGRKVRVQWDLGGEGVVECVPEEWNQLMTNVIQNAIEAVSEDGSGRVDIGGHSEGDWQIFTVRDNGPGIKPEDRDKLFTPFFTTKGPGTGMGLGLTIAYRVVLSLGGTLQAKSQPDQGAEFVIRVPRRQGQTAAAKAPALAAVAT